MSREHSLYPRPPPCSHISLHRQLTTREDGYLHGSTHTIWRERVSTDILLLDKRQKYNAECDTDFHPPTPNPQPDHLPSPVRKGKSLQSHREPENVPREKAPHQPGARDGSKRSHSHPSSLLHPLNLKSKPKHFLSNPLPWQQNPNTKERKLNVGLNF